MRILIDVLIAIGAVFALAGTIGVLKMPDTFCRMQASTCIATLGVIGVALGGILYAVFMMGSAGTAVKIALVAVLVIATNPIGAHSIAKAAYQAGVRPEKEMETDDYGRDFND